MANILDVEGLCVTAAHGDGFGRQIVSDVSFSVGPAEVVALIGESGSGKTTVALSALGYSRPGLEISGGRLLFGGIDIRKMDNGQLRRFRGRKVAYMAQSAAAAFNPAIPLGRQLTESAVLAGEPEASARERAQHLIRAVQLPNPEAVAERYPHQFSGGQLQRLMFVMALCSRPNLLVLDEPTTALDVTTQLEVLRTIKDIMRQEGMSAIYVSHDLSVVSQIADRIVVLLNGEIQEQGETKQILSNPSSRYTRELISAARHVGIGGGRPKESESALSLTGVSATYFRGAAAPRLVIQDITFDLKRGEAVGIIGESGSGKSSLARVIAGLLPPVDGEVRLGPDRLAGSVRERSVEQLRRIQLVPQMADTALNPAQRLLDIVRRPLDFYRRGPRKDRRNRAVEVLAETRLPVGLAQRYPRQLSGGQKQRANLARALAASPDVLICDEVTAALDTIVSAGIIELLDGLKRKLKLSIVFVSHDLATVSGFADEIIVLYAGRIVEKGRAEAVLAPPYHPYTRLLLLSVPELRTGWLEETAQTRAALTTEGERTFLVDRGCRFFPRCPIRIDGRCDTVEPPVQDHGEGHAIACHRDMISSQDEAPWKPGGAMVAVDEELTI